MTKEGVKHKSNAKKSTMTPPNAEFETYVTSQQNIIVRLKAELKALIAKVDLLDNGLEEKNKCIIELEQIINQREAEIHKLCSNLNQFKEENSRILIEFNSFKVKFYQLETEYDNNLKLQLQENDNLRQELQKLQTTENREIQELTLKCQDLEQNLQNNIKEFSHLNKLHVETLHNFEQMKTNFEIQHKEFELYKKKVSEDKSLNEERAKLQIDELKDELRQKDEVIEQCTSDKNTMEKEKNLVIDELKNKIFRIEKAFNQPTKAVQPTTTSNEPVNNSSTNDNVGISKPHVRKPLENISSQTTSNDENRRVEQNQMQRNYKFKRPADLQTSSQQSNVATSRKKRNQPLRQFSTAKTYNEFSSTSSSDDDDNDSNYNTFSQKLWRPNTECYVADTDASEGFANPKRSKNII